MTRLERLLKLRYNSPPPTVQVLFEGEPVAELTRGPGANYFFQYLDAFKQKGLAPLPGLQDLGKLYESSELFPFFEERLPDLRRPEIRQWIKEQGVSEDDKLALLGALSHRTVTDSFELRFNKAA